MSDATDTDWWDTISDPVLGTSFVVAGAILLAFTFDVVTFEWSVVALLGVLSVNSSAEPAIA